MRLIDADALIYDITKFYCKDCAKRKGIKKGKLKFVYEIGDAPCRACQLDDMKDAIENAPTVDTERHGHWEKLNDDNDRWRCSHCGWAFIGFNGMHTTFAEMCDYCPHCGALMDKEVEDE